MLRIKIRSGMFPDWVVLAIQKGKTNEQISEIITCAAVLPVSHRICFTHRYQFGCGNCYASAAIVYDSIDRA